MCHHYTIFNKVVIICREHEDIKQAYYCLKKAIVADPEDINLHSTRASLYVELEKYQKAAECYEKISRLRPDDIEVLQKATQVT